MNNNSKRLFQLFVIRIIIRFMTYPAADCSQTIAMPSECRSQTITIRVPQPDHHCQSAPARPSLSERLNQTTTVGMPQPDYYHRSTSASTRPLLSMCYLGALTTSSAPENVHKPEHLISWTSQPDHRGCVSDLPPDMLKPAANQAFGNKSCFWQQMKKKVKRKLQKLFSEDGLYFWQQRKIHKKVGGKSLFAGNAGFKHIWQQITDTPSVTTMCACTSHTICQDLPSYATAWKDNASCNNSMDHGNYTDLKPNSYRSGDDWPD